MLARCKQVKFIINFIKNIQLSDSFTRFLVLNYLFGNELNNHDLKALSISEESFEKRVISAYPNYDKTQFLRYSIYEIVEKIVLVFNLENDAYVHHFKNFFLTIKINTQAI